MLRDGILLPYLGQYCAIPRKESVGYLLHKLSVVSCSVRVVSTLTLHSHKYLYYNTLHHFSVVRSRIALLAAQNTPLVFQITLLVFQASLNDNMGFIKADALQLYLI